MLFGQIWSRWLHLGGIHSSAQTQNRGWDTSVCSLSLSWFFGSVYVRWAVHSCTLHPHFFPDCSSDLIVWIVSLWASQHTFSAKLHPFLCCEFLCILDQQKENVFLCSLFWWIVKQEDCVMLVFESVMITLSSGFTGCCGGLQVWNAVYEPCLWGYHQLTQFFRSWLNMKYWNVYFWFVVAYFVSGFFGNVFCTLESSSLIRNIILYLQNFTRRSKLRNYLPFWIKVICFAIDP